MADKNITAAEAVGILKKIKNHYRAFEEAESLLVTLAAAESSIAAAHGEVAKEKKACEKAKKATAEALAEHQRITSEIEEAGKSLQESHQAQIKALDSELRQRIERVDEETEKHKEVKANEEAEIRQRIDNLRRTEEKLLNSVDKLTLQLKELKLAAGAM